MRATRTMTENVDSTGWATFGTTVGLFTAAQFISQFATAMLTLVTGIIVAHFLKRALNYYWPLKRRTETQESE
jgi:hypothetical protein